MDLGLQDRVYVVTGASRGLGRAAAGALVAEGARVVICSRDEAAARRAAEELDGAGGRARALGMRGDLADESTAEQVPAAAMARFGRLDGALVSVGGPPGGSMLDTHDEQWREAFESVFLGALRMARAVAGQLRDHDGGALAFVLSTSVRAPLPGLAVSNGLRPGLAMVAKSLADELGPRGIRVNGLLPGRVETDRVRELDLASEAAGEDGTDAAQVKAEHEARIPLRRYGQPAEFGRVAAFVLSPAASYLSGVMLPVDGGATRTL